MKKELRTDFTNMDLRGWNFKEHNLTNVNFKGANLEGACFIDAVLVDANFEGANLTGASFEDANIITAEFDNTTGIYPVCPTEGSFTGWTLAEDSNGDDCIVEVSIPTWAQRNSGATRKCRAEALYVESIERLKDGYDPIEITLKFRDYILTEKEHVYDEDFESDRFKTSSTDLYFWISKEEALAHTSNKI